MQKMLVVAAFMCASLQAQIPTGSTRHGQSTANTNQSVNPVIEWNRALLVIVRTPGAQPATVHSTRSFAILHAAIYDSVNNIVRRFTPYLVRLPDVSPETSQVAAADQAGHDVFLALYPTFQTTLDAELQQDLAQIADGKPKTDGIAVGQTVAAQILTFRANDGSGVTPPPFQSKDVPGFYQPTPPDFTPADFTQWGDVIPFAIVNAREFLPDPPPALTDKEYVRDLAEVQSIGEIENYWNEITQTAAIRHNLDLEQTARLFALVNFGMADATISFFEAKYVYHFWRPVTPAELSDPDWLPLSTKTAPDPSYPGAHSATSSAAATVLEFYFGDRFSFDVTSEVLPGVTRHFRSFSAAKREAGLSRIYAGQHFRFDHLAGLRLGREVSRSITETALRPE